MKTSKKKVEPKKCKNLLCVRLQLLEFIKPQNSFKEKYIMCRRGSESRQTSRLQTLVGGHTLTPQNSSFDRYRKRLFKKILKSDKEQLVEGSQF